MSKKEDIIKATAELLQIQGYYATGINEIVAKSKSPKGSIYHYFKNGKDEIVIEALQYSGNEIRLLLETLSDNTKTMKDFISGVFDFYIMNLAESSFTKGCPVSTTAMETSGKIPSINQKIKEIYVSWIEIISKKLSYCDISVNSDIFISLLEGALITAKMQQSVRPLESAKNLAILLATTIDPKHSCK